LAALAGPGPPSRTTPFRAHLERSALTLKGQSAVLASVSIHTNM
jgi:hypothetical protein